MERFNIWEDTLLEHATEITINTHILNSPIAIYINNKYYPNNYVCVIHNHCGEMEAKTYINKK